MASETLLIKGELFHRDKPYRKRSIFIEPGEIAWLSTIEAFHMPSDLAGSIGMKFKFARKGITPLFGFQVDPYYGVGIDDERLYLAVSNLGPLAVKMDIEQSVFLIEFHEVIGTVQHLQRRDSSVRELIENEASELAESAVLANVGGRDSRLAQLGFLNAMEKRLDDKYSSRLKAIERGTQQIVLFGVFLVASALLAGSFAAFISIVLGVRANTSASTSNMADYVNGTILAIAILLTLAVLGFGFAMFVLVKKWFDKQQ